MQVGKLLIACGIINHQIGMYMAKKISLLFVCKRPMAIYGPHSFKQLVSTVRHPKNKRLNQEVG